MEYIILHVTEEDVRRALASIPSRLRLGGLDLPEPGFHAYFSPYGSAAGARLLGTFQTEAEAAEAVHRHVPTPAEWPGANTPAGDRRTVRKELRRPIKYGAYSDAGTRSTETCDRCGSHLTVHTLSWFTLETLCTDCFDAEAAVKERLRKAGVHDAMEGCGFLPGEADIALEAWKA